MAKIVKHFILLHNIIGIGLNIEALIFHNTNDKAIIMKFKSILLITDLIIKMRPI